MTKEYHIINLGDSRTLVRPGSTGVINEITGVVFDCDGVLIDASRSYNKSVGLTVSYILSIIIGRRFPNSFVSERMIYSIRRSGGFNNDCDTVYIILIKLLSMMPVSLADSYGNLFDNASTSHPYDSYRRLNALAKRSVDSKLPLESFDTLRRSSNVVIEFSSRLDENGIETGEKIIRSISKRKIGLMLRSLKRFLQYPEDIGKSIVNTIFDEFFYGPNLFNRVHGRVSRIKGNNGNGTIYSERLIVNERTLKSLSDRFGMNNVGIASGRGSVATFQTLDVFSRYINNDAMVFLDDLNWKESNLGKPSPYSLIKAAEPLAGDGKILYVGDSTEDIMMVKKANQKIKNRFLFAGIYGSSPSTRESIRIFRECKADIILRSVNDLPSVFGGLVK